MKTHFGNHLGICINNVDPENRGRVQIFIPHIMPALYEGWNELGEDIKLECVGNNLPNGLSSKVIEKLTQILPWAEAAMPVIGNSVAGTYSPETGNFNQTNTPESTIGTIPGSTSNMPGGSLENASGIDYIYNSEARKDANGKILVYNLPAGDGGGAYEIAGINNRYHPQEAAALKTLIEQGRHQEAETRAKNYIANYTNNATKLSTNPGVEYALRDAAFNRGQGGANWMAKYAAGLTPSLKMSDAARQQILKTQQADPAGYLKRLREATERYERDVVGVRPQFIKGLTNRWNDRYQNSLNLLGNSNISLNDPASLPDASAVQPSNNPFYTSQEPYHVQKQPTQEAITATTVNAPTPVTAGGFATARRGPTITSRAGASFASGALDLTLPDGTTRTYQFNNGGFGAGAIPAGNYTVTNPRIRDTNGMVVEGVGYSFDLSDKYDPKAGRDRKLLRIHPDGGATGTQGCLGIVGGAAIQKQFYQDMKLLVDTNGGKFGINVSDNLPESGVPGASTGGNPTLDTPSQLVKNPTETQATALDTTGMAQGMFGIPGPGAMLWVFFREGDPLFPVYFAASYGAAEWQSAYKASSPPAYGPQENLFTSISNQTVFRPNNAGAITFTGAVDTEKDSRALRMAHANGGYFELHPYGTIHYSPNEYLEQVAGTSYKYCLNREEWTQGDDNRVTIGNQWVVIGNPSQANIETIEKLTEKVKQINAEMMKN